MPQMPGMPAAPGMPQPPQVHVQDLGKSFMQGQEVEGKRYTIQPPAMPQMPQMAKAQVPGPQMPGMPQMPQAPGMPNPPAMPQIPPKPQLPSTAEVWTSPKLQLPMASRINGSFGQQTAICQNAVPGEPNPAIFQAPPDYKQILPAPPKLPNMPKPPIPSVTPPKLPGM
jgi:integrin beta 8